MKIDISTPPDTSPPDDAIASTGAVLTDNITVRNAIAPKATEVQGASRELHERKAAHLAEIEQIRLTNERCAAERVRAGTSASASDGKEFDIRVRRKAILETEVSVLDQMIAEAQTEAEAIAAEYGTAQAQVTIAAAHHRGAHFAAIMAQRRAHADEDVVLDGLSAAMHRALFATDKVIASNVVAEVEQQNLEWIRTRDAKNRQELARRWAQLIASIPE